LRKFIFPLENVLEYRQNIEEHERELLVRVIQRAQVEEKFLNELSLSREQHLNSYKPDKVNLTIMQQQEVHLQLLNSRINSQLKKLVEAKKSVEIHNRKLVDARQKRKMIENIKKKRLEEYHREQAKEEQGVLDEAGIAAYHRKNNW